nr:hypothetical protein [Tanacetum cinerariifolium]GEY66958.1 hypothetical protein [Tanacetum cinerariifolium]
GGVTHVYKEKDDDEQAEDEEPINDQAGSEQARNTQANVVVLELVVPNPSFSLTLASAKYGNQFLNISSNTLLVGILKDPTKVEIQLMVDVPIHQENLVKSRSFLTHEKHIDLYNSLVNSTMLDEAIASGEVNPYKVLKRSQPDDEDPPAGFDKEKKRMKRKDSEPLKDKEQSGSTPKADQTMDAEEDKWLMLKNIHKMMLLPSKSTWFKQSPRQETLDLKWQKEPNADDGPEHTWFNDLVKAKKDQNSFDDLIGSTVDFTKFTMNRLKKDKITKADLEVRVNGDSAPPKRTVDGVEQTYPPTTAEEKLERKNELKAIGTLLMALTNEHQLKFNFYKNAKSLMEAIEKRDPRKNRNREPVRRNVTVETTYANALVAQHRFGYDWSDQAEDGPTNFAFMAYTSSGSSSSSSSYSEVSTCSKACLKSYETLKEHYDNFLKDYKKSQLNVRAYKTGLESVEARLVVYKKNEDIFEENIKILKLDIQLRDNALTELRKKLEKDEKERDEIKITLKKFENSSKTLNKMLDSQVNDKNKTGVGYHAVLPLYTGNFMPSKPDLILVDVDEYVGSESVTSVSAVATNEAKTSESKPKSVSEPLIEDWVSNNEDENETETKFKQRKPSFAKVEFVKPNEKVKSPGESVK